MAIYRPLFSVFPTCVGGDPINLVNPQTSPKYSPHAWGVICLGLFSTNAAIVFPTCVGGDP